jgi:hypothetical protein
MISLIAHRLAINGQLLPLAARAAPSLERPVYCETGTMSNANIPP